MKCRSCGGFCQHVGTSPEGADCWQCVSCSRIQFVAVTAKPPADPTVRRPDAHLGGIEP